MRFRNWRFIVFTVCCLSLTGSGCIEIQEDPSGRRTDSLPSPISRCGDRVCDDMERQSGRCPQDCPEDLRSEPEVTSGSAYIPLN